ncbi:MAG: DUF4339 domain-containing protein [Chlamydiae bacterium]|nr:DUF4339 domain-containing protein [Chlamydiota bacterium]
MNPGFFVLSWLVTGIISAYMAHKKQKNLFLWFAIGLFFGIFGIAYLYFLIKKEALQEKTKPILPPPKKEVKPTEEDLVFWYYLDKEDKSTGPISFTALMKELKIGNITNTTYVWNENLTSWRALNEVSKSENLSQKTTN